MLQFHSLCGQTAQKSFLRRRIERKSYAAVQEEIRLTNLESGTDKSKIARISFEQVKVLWDFLGIFNVGIKAQAARFRVW